MFFNKSERKKHSSCVPLVVGALAAIGAFSITRRGKMMVKGAFSKMKGMLGQNGCSEVCSADRQKDN